MNTAAAGSPLPVADRQFGPENMLPAVPPTMGGLTSAEAGMPPGQKGTAKTRVFVAAENRLLREALGRMLNKRGCIEVTGSDSPEPFRGSALLEGQADVMLLISKGNLEEDLAIVREAHGAAPGVRILVIGATRESGEFLQCVRAGISGFLWREASADDVGGAICGGQSGEAVGPGALCTALFRYFEQESSPVPCAGEKPADPRAH